MIQSMELNKLCAIILEKTIADPDMYQNGLTKIFFRAGMLAALESMRSGRLNALVTVVQKNMRRRMAVKRYKELRTATIKIQTWWRGILARKLVENMKKQACALRVQTAIRRFVQRKRFVDVRRSVVLVQSRKSFSSTQSPYSVLNTSILLGIRGVQARQNFRSQRSATAATTLQSLLRGVYVGAYFNLLRNRLPN